MKKKPRRKFSHDEIKAAVCERKRFGRLVVLEIHLPHCAPSQTSVLVECECGATSVTRWRDLMPGVGRRPVTACRNCSMIASKRRPATRRIMQRIAASSETQERAAKWAVRQGLVEGLRGITSQARQMRPSLRLLTPERIEVYRAAMRGRE